MQQQRPAVARAMGLECDSRDFLHAPF